MRTILSALFFFSLLQRPPSATLFPYTTLFRSESEFTRNRLKAFMSPEDCDACGGQRLKPEILAITLGPEVTSPTLNRSEEHTSELQSPCKLVCRLLLEKKKKHYSQSTRTQLTN